jgi:ornithine cyclodeaminase/alanine dehydrogenase-like protein (mu-crystallin family)
MSEIPVVDYDAVLAAVPPARAIERVADAFVKHTRGEWSMPAKVYLQAPPNGDFRAMPALGDGLAILKWVTSFPGNPSIDRPVVYGTIVVSDASTGEPLAIVDGRSVTALRTGAAAAVATRALVSEPGGSVGIVGCGLHGRWAARCLAEVGFGPGVCFDPDESAAASVAEELGWSTGSRADALDADVVTLITPGREPVVGAGELHPGVHVNAMGADGSGKAEMDIDEVLRCELFCDEWAQASHGGELTGAVEGGRLHRESVVELGRVLGGEHPGRSGPQALTLFDSTGLAIQDLAIVTEVMEALGREAIEAPTVSL